MPNVDEMWKGAREAITVKRVYGDPVESNGVMLSRLRLSAAVPAAAAKKAQGEAAEGASA